MSDIGVIQTGIYAKTAVKGEVAYVQARHFDEDGRQLEKFLTELPLSEIKRQHLLVEGDVLFAAKGTKNFAVAVAKDWGQAVASTSFFVIRLNTADVFPSYVAWFINHPTQQQKLKAMARGTAIASIGREALVDMEIPIPPRHLQELIVKIEELRKRENSIKKQLEELREQYLQQLLLKSIKQ